MKLGFKLPVDDGRPTVVLAAQSRRRTQIILRTCPPGRVNVHTGWANLLHLVWFLSARRRITVRSFGT